MTTTENNKKKVLIHAPAYTASGYGVHSRQIIRALNDRNDFELYLTAVQWGDTSFILRDFEHKEILDKANANYATDDKDFDISFQIVLPDEFDNRAKFNVGITAAVETTTCNPEWAKGCNMMDLVIVPSEHTKKVLLSASVKTPIEVVHETFPDALNDKYLECNLDLDIDTKFNFLHVGQMVGNEKNDRKNILALIRIFCETFKDNKDVGLILKTNSCKNTIIDRELTLNTIKGYIQKYRTGEFPKIYVLHGVMSTDEICQLYKHEKIKAFITLTRGEGFGLPIIEAAAAGLPVLATNWSGHLDFMNCVEKSFIKLNYELIDLPPERLDDRIFIKGAKWAQVDEHDVRRKMKKVYESYNVPHLWAKNLQNEILNKFNYDAMKNKLLDIFNIHYKER